MTELDALCRAGASREEIIEAQATRIEQLEKATDIAIQINNDQVGQIEELEAENTLHKSAMDNLAAKLTETERRRDELALIIATDTGTEGAVAELQRQRDELWAALENCRLLAARQRKKVWAEFVLRYCSDVGVTGSPLRTAAARKEQK